MKTVMIVDDSMILRKKLTKVFEELDYKVVATAKTGIEAVNMYEQFIPDIVTMDITMPDMTGIEAVKIIIEKYPNANIIMSSSHADLRTIKEALLFGAKGYTVKPVTKNKLEEEINKIFNDETNDDDELLDD